MPVSMISSTMTQSLPAMSPTRFTCTVPGPVILQLEAQGPVTLQFETLAGRVTVQLEILRQHSARRGMRVETMMEAVFWFSGLVFFRVEA